MSTLSPKYFTVATAGHVDHGKTSLLRALTGIDPDRLKEEKLRQMTTDLGFAHLSAEIGNRGEELVIGFIDVPGHGKFLKNMLAGVGGIQLALLVVAADEGPMPQTQAHVKILRMLGIGNALVVLTKIDLASTEQQDDALERTSELLKRYEINQVGCARVDNNSRKGFDELKAGLIAALSGGKLVATASDINAPAYLPIDRVFTKAGYGLVVTGTLVRGDITTGDTIFVEPGHIKARVRGLETFGRTLSRASAGQRLAINLTFREHTELVRGQCVLSDDLTPCSVLIAVLDKTSDPEDKQLDRTLVHQLVRIYHGTAEASGHVSWCESLNGHTIIQIKLNESIAAEPGDRFVMRYGDTGITGGDLVCTARPRWLTRPKLIDLVQASIKCDTRDAINLFLDACPQRTVRLDALNCIQPRHKRDELIAEAVSAQRVIRLADYIVTNESFAFLTTKLTNQLRQNADETDQKHTPLETIRAKVLPGIDRAAFQAFLKRLTDENKLIRRGDRLLLPGAITDGAKSAPQAELETNILKLLSDCFCLEIIELAKQLNRDEKQINAAISQMSKESRAFIVNYDFAACAEKLHEAHQVLAEIWSRKRDISPSEFRERLNTSRKYAMALLAHFDDHSVTRRVNNSRVLLKSPKKD